MPSGNGWMSCLRYAPGRSSGSAAEWGATSQTGPIARSWTRLTSVSDIHSPGDHSPGSIAWPYTQSAAFA